MSCCRAQLLMSDSRAVSVHDNGFDQAQEQAECKCHSREAQDIVLRSLWICGLVILLLTGDATACRWAASL